MAQRRRAPVRTDNKIFLVFFYQVIYRFHYKQSGADGNTAIGKIENRKIDKGGLDIVDNKSPCNAVNKVTRTAGYNNRHTPVNKTGLNFLRHEQENKHDYNNRRKNRQKNRLILHGAERRTGVLDIADADKTEKNIHAVARRKAVDNSNFYNLVDSHKRGNHQKGYCLNHKNLKNLFFKETSEARMAGMIVVIIIVVIIVIIVAV